MELIKAGEKTFYFDAPTKVGFYMISENEIILIDSGNDKDAARKVYKTIDSLGYTIKAVINTHSHADHIGGNNFLQSKFDCPFYILDTEDSFVTYPILEPSMLFGGYPPKILQNKFLMAKPSNVKILTKENIPQGLSYINLKGHCFNMTGIKTSDNIWFIADSLASEETLEKYHINYIYNVEEYIKTLGVLENLEGKLFIPSHGEVKRNIKDLVTTNRNKVFEIIEIIKNILEEPCCFDELLKKIFDKFGLKININQYALAGSTIKSYLSYLYDLGELELEYVDNMVCWKIK